MSTITIEKLAPRWIGALIPSTQLDRAKTLPQLLDTLTHDKELTDFYTNQAVSRGDAVWGFSQMFSWLFQGEWSKDHNAKPEDEVNRYLELGFIDSERMTCQIVSRGGQCAVAFTVGSRKPEGSMLPKPIPTAPTAAPNLALPRAVDFVSLNLTTAIMYLLLSPVEQSIQQDQALAAGPNAPLPTYNKYAYREARYNRWLPQYLRDVESINSELRGLASGASREAVKSHHARIQGEIRDLDKKIQKSSLPASAKSWSQLMAELSVCPVGVDRVFFLCYLKSMMDTVSSFRDSFGPKASSGGGGGANAKLFQALKRGAVQGTTQTVLEKVSDKITPLLGTVAPGVGDHQVVREGLTAFMPFLLLHVLESGMIPDIKHKDKVKHLLIQAMEGASASISHEVIDQLLEKVQEMMAELDTQEVVGAAGRTLGISLEEEKVRETVLEMEYA